MLLLLVACESAGPLHQPTQKTEGTETDPGPQPAELAEVSGDCPEFSATGADFESNGLTRNVYTWLPADPAGAPVMFYFHPLGGTASYMNQVLRLQRWSDENNVVVIAPNSKDDNQFEWDFWNGLDDDLVLFDDLRTCAVNNLGVDPKRIYASGMSAGGLWTSFLSTRRGDSLAAILPFSGGDGDVWQYETPASPFPALLVYGGDDDIYGSGVASVNFKDSTLQFASELSDDGHFVALCNHNSGHTLPPETMDITTAWLLPHVFGEASPFEDGLEGFPSWCDVGPEAIDR